MRRKEIWRNKKMKKRLNSSVCLFFFFFYSWIWFRSKDDYIFPSSVSSTSSSQPSQPAIRRFIIHLWNCNSETMNKQRIILQLHKRKIFSRFWASQRVWRKFIIPSARTKVKYIIIFLYLCLVSSPCC